MTQRNTAVFSGIQHRCVASQHCFIIGIIYEICYRVMLRRTRLLPWHVVCPSVRPSATLRYRYHIWLEFLENNFS